MDSLKIPAPARHLPVAEIAAEVNASLKANPSAVITAPPGSGKSTLLPLTILQGMEPEQRLIMLEPRRAAARQIAMRMASLLGEEVGQTVGYRMRFEQKVSAQTRIEVVTEGIMERMLVDDPTLDGVGAVIFDEFHERSLTADLTLALTLEARNLLRPDLRIVVMSATIDTEFLCKALNAPLIEAKGSIYPVEIIYGEDFDTFEAPQAVVSAVRRAWREQSGNILAFLPGQGEITRCAEALAEFIPDAVILPLYGMLSPAQQYRAIEFNPEGQRKIVLATPIAETSLTIEGITTVIDSGLFRIEKFDVSTGLNRLVTERISMDMATQRAGRAGRLAPGVCYRLWSRPAEHRMNERRQPEILDADLSAMVLDIAAWGSSDPASLPWITPPPAGHIASARKLLEMLGAIDTQGKLTATGRRIAALPCHPRIAGMLTSAETPELQALAADIAALLEEKDPLNSETDSDINSRIAILRSNRRRGEGDRWKRIARIAEQYRRIIRCREENDRVDPYETGRLLASAYPERIAMRVADNLYRLPSGENVKLNEADDLSAQEFLVVASMGSRIFLASPISRKDVEALAQPYRNISWNSREGRVVARNDLRLGLLTVASRPLENIDREEINAVLCQAAQKDGRSMFSLSDDEFVRTVQRVATVASWHSELDIPDVSPEALIARISDWLPLFVGKATTVADLRKINLCDVVTYLLGYELQGEIDRIAPTHLRLPSGRNVRIDYRPGTPDPVVSARLQDCLGLTDTPCLDGGKRPVLMELLSPGFKPVQLTRDLRGFWTGTYFDVRKELRRRYPKHLWPDNPLDF